MSDARPDRVYFLVKAPRWTFIWWRLSNLTLREISATIGCQADPTKLHLRIHDVTDIVFTGGNSHSFEEIYVGGDTNHWYWEVGAPNRNYVAVLGFKYDDRFFPAATSNTAFVPRETTAESHA